MTVIARSKRARRNRTRLIGWLRFYCAPLTPRDESRGASPFWCGGTQVRSGGGGKGADAPRRPLRVARRGRSCVRPKPRRVLVGRRLRRGRPSPLRRLTRAERRPTALGNPQAPRIAQDLSRRVVS